MECTIVFDDKNFFEEKNNIFYLNWNRSQLNKIFSLQNYIDENQDRIKKKYLSLIYQISQYRYKNKTVYEIFNFKNYYNLWLMSLINEKCPIKSPRITDCIKLIALEEIFDLKKITGITIYSQDKNIVKSLSDLCFQKNISFKQIKDKNFFSINIKLFIKKKLILINSIYFLICNIRKYFIIKRKLKPILFNKNSISIFSYFINFNFFKNESIEFQSNYWGNLPKLLNEQKIEINWIHDLVNDSYNSNLNDNFKNIIKLNKFDHNKHFVLQSSLTIDKFIKIFFNYLKIYSKTKIINKKDIFTMKDSKINFWNLLKDDWNFSFNGSHLIYNLMIIEMYDCVLKNSPFQKAGFYLQENQGWEYALLGAWRKYKHGKIYGVAHSSIRYWDLRYFFDNKHFLDTKLINKFAPNKTIINGPLASKILKNSSHPENRLLHAEALRYMHLIENNNNNMSRSMNFTKILALGDIDINTTKSMILCLEKINNLNIQTDISIKLHPATYKDLLNFTDFKLINSSRSLDEIIKTYDLIIIAGSTSAFYEVYLLNKKMVVYLDPSKLNLSPSTSFSNIIYVSSTKELEYHIKNLPLNNKNLSINDIFWVDQDLIKWKNIIKNL